MKRILFILPIMVLCFCCKVENNKNSKDRNNRGKSDFERLIDKIDKCKTILDFNFITHGDYENQLARRMMDVATFEQVDSLFEHGKTANIRAVAFMTMCHYDSMPLREHTFAMLIDHMNDTSQVFFFADDDEYEYFGSFATRMAFENKILSPKDSAYVDSLILYDKAYRSNYRFWNILESNCTDERFHERIWEIYFETRELRLLYYIAISHKEKDFDLVMSAFEKELAKVSTEGQYYDVIFWTLAAMDNWPDIRFRGLVTEIGKKYAHNSFHVMNGYLLFVFVLQQDIKWGEPFIKEVMETIIANDDKDGLYIKQSAGALYMANITVGNKKYQRIVDRYCSGYDENVKLRWTYQESGYSHLIKTIKH